MATPLQVPALRGAMGDWVYYMALMPFEEVRIRIKKTDEIHSSKLLREWIQRALTDRSERIAEYLSSHRQRFFNALVIGVYGGTPEWHQVSLRKSKLFDPIDLDERVAESMGFLRFTGSENLFAIDGQHRVEGIKKFIAQLQPKEQRSLSDEICAIFVAHRNTPAGMQRTRRLFTTLNRTAKPVNLTEIIALDEDDIVAIVCRNLLETHTLFRDGRVSTARQKAISTEDHRSITSLQALHQTMNIYLADKKGKEWEKFRALRPKEDDVESYLQKARSFWDDLIQAIPQLQVVVKLRANQDLPFEFRNNENGGDLLFRPIFPPMLARCLRAAERKGIDERTFIQRVANVPRRLNHEPWLGLLWDGNMITRSKNQKLAEALLLWIIRVPTRDDAASLRLRLASVLSREANEIRLPNRV
jgi:DNA sulfur modification protein DndB